MNVTDKLREDAHQIWKKIIKHPFVEELCRGDLPLDKFKFYVLQDYHYLVTAMQNFGVIVSKAASVADMREVIDILNLEAKSEFDGYIKLLKKLGYTPEAAAAVDPVSVSVSYSSFLLSTSSLTSYAEALTAVLPCFWSYAEIGHHHRERLYTNKVPVYRDWGETYSTASYLHLVEKLKSMVEKAGEDCSYDKLRKAFITSSRFEYMFWDAVYNQIDWPV